MLFSLHTLSYEEISYFFPKENCALIQSFMRTLMCSWSFSVSEPPYYFIGAE